jgi:hypothetical protein
MKFNSWGILAFFGSLIFLVFFIKDWETKVGADKLSRMKLPHQSSLEDDLGVQVRYRAQPLYAERTLTHALSTF